MEVRPRDKSKPTGKVSLMAPEHRNGYHVTLPEIKEAFAIQGWHLLRRKSQALILGRVVIK